MYGNTPGGYGSGPTNPWTGGGGGYSLPPVGPSGERIDPGMVLLFSLLTCGIYYFWWIAKVSDETQKFLNEPDTSPTVEVILTLVTCGIYNLYWDYKMAKKIARMQAMVGLTPTDNAVLYLVLNLVGLGILNPLMQQGHLNDVWLRAGNAQRNY